jgi:hypothetical protein
MKEMQSNKTKLTVARHYVHSELQMETGDHCAYTTHCPSLISKIGETFTITNQMLYPCHTGPQFNPLVHKFFRKVCSKFMLLEVTIAVEG